MKVEFTDKSFQYFSDFNITLIYDAVASTFSFKALNSMLGTPLVYSFVKLYGEEDELLLTGYILSSGYIISSKPEFETYPGYSITGFLEDSSVPFPLQSDNLTLKEITDKLLKPFGFKYIVDPIVAKDMNKKYVKSIASEGQSIKDYLTTLATQRGIILSHNNKGELVFTKIEINKLKPVYTFDEGYGGSTNMSLTANGQQMHSSIRIVKEATEDNTDAGDYTIKNPYVTNRYRPIIKILSSGDIFDVKKAARMELSKELMGIELIIETTKFILPGNLISVKAQKLKIRNFTNFFVTQCEIKGTNKNITYTLTCLLPDCFSDNEVKNIFL